ncbi:signal transduction histidine kinase (STHK), LytS [Leptolyngbya sp. AN02str]|uniref:signal transduction histidine kinase (STHK), LytS n=1 Tax=Leptolyngbya sp. AN02str TaxID=3423363 RepID=UPI003D31E6F0
MNSSTTQYKRAVGVFKHREDLESALQALLNAGIDRDRISLIGRHTDDLKGADEVRKGQDNLAQEGAGIGASTGTILGGIGGFLVGAGVLAIPGVGPIFAAGVGISEIAATLAGAGIGAATGGIVGALVGAGIPEDRAKVYDERVKAGDYLLLVDGTDESLRRVESILRDRHVEEFGIYNAPDLEQSRQATGATTATYGTSDRDQVTGHRPFSNERDIDNDGEPEVIIVDNRDETIRRNEVR